MTGRRTPRIAAAGAGALLALGIWAAPAGAAQVKSSADNASVSAETDAVTQTLDLVNQTCAQSAQPTVSVSLPDLVQSLPAVGSLLGNTTAPLTVSCATAADGTGLGLSAAGVGAVVNAVAPGLDLSGLDLSGILGAATVSAATQAGPAAATVAPAPGSTPAPAPAASSRAAVQSPTVKASAGGPRTAAAVATATPASSNGIVAQTIGSPGALARTGAGVGLLGLLGTALIGSGRLMAFARRFLRA